MSSSLKFCVLAAGEADIYAAKARAFEWDIAAGHAILEHAGGFITTHEEEEILYGKKNLKKRLSTLSLIVMLLEKLLYHVFIKPATVEESTPPDIATTTFVSFGSFEKPKEFAIFTEIFIK